MKQKQLQKRQERRGGSSLLLKMFALVALMLCSVGSVWGQDATILFTKDWGSNQTTVNGYKVDIENNDWTNLESFTDHIVLSQDAYMTLSGKNVRYIRITFANNTTNYNLKWGGGNDAKNPVNGTGSIILVSNFGSDNIKIVNDTEKGTTSTPIKKVEVFYHQNGFCTATADHTEANATKKVPVTGITCVKNTISLDKVNVVGQYCSFSSINGNGIMMNTSGDHYLSIKFENPINLTNLDYLDIEGTNVAKSETSGIFNQAQFICESGNFDKYNNPAHADNFNDDQKAKLAAVKEIRLFNGEREGVFTISAIKLVYKNAKVAPTLNNGTTTEMMIREGENLTLSNEYPGFWREYTDNTYSSEKNPNRISGWESSVTFDGTTYANLPQGDYYFATRDEGDCSACGVRHASELTKVHVKVVKRITPKPKCNVELGNDGGNYFGLNNLNAGPGVTISETTEGWTKVTTGSENGYVSFNFAESYNLKDLDSWAVTDDPSVYGNVDAVEFFNGGTKIRTYNNDAGHRNSITQELKNELTAVDEIRIYFKKNTETAFNWIRFKFVHRPPTVPTLTNGTEPNMIIRKNGTLELTNTPGYWRQFTDDTYTTIKTKDDGGLINQDSEWNTHYVFENMEVGHYYFAARDAGDECALNNGQRHPDSDPTTVHVEVTDKPIVAAKTDPEGLDATFDIYMGPDHMDWKVTNNSFVNLGTGMSFAVSDVPGYVFKGWYVDGVLKSDDQNGYNYGGVFNDVTAVAKFERDYTSTDFTGYFPFINRLRAQWNFDQCDVARFNVSALGENWTVNTDNYLSTGEHYKEYIYNKSLDNEELRYGDTEGHEIPISAGLKFKAGANQVSIRVYYKDGVMTGTKLVCKSGVRMTVPYVENSCRNDRGENYPSVVAHSADKVAAAREKVFAPGYIEGTDTDAEGIAKGNFSQAEIDAAKAKVSAEGYVPGSDKMAEVAATKDKACNTSYIANQEGFKNCMHHMKRDILYIALAGGGNWSWGDNGEGAYFVDKAIDRNGNMLNQEMFYPAGDENVNGVHWWKNDFLGVPGDPCTFELSREAVFDRIAVNRNITASYYTEYIDKMGYETPKPGMRIRVDTKGLRVASDGSTSGYWDGAISMTYGGWSINGQTYSNFAGEETPDAWGENTVWSGVDPTDIHKVPTTSDGFPVISNASRVARSESLMPSTSKDPYHPGNEGKFNLTTYKANLTPWTLPCRGSYVKFEPTHPGVLNIHVVQEGGKEYYIADEFGKLDREIPNTMTWTKAATEDNSISYNSTTGGYSSGVKDYVKYSFNVYPGKSYYFFSNDATFGFAGFFFEPYVTRINTTKELDREDVLMDNFSFDDNSNYTAPATWYVPGSQPVAGVPGVYANTIYSPKKFGLDPDAVGNDFTNTDDWQPYTINYSRNAIRATYRRDGAGFQANKWTSICLPFSMNQYQMEEQFGAGTKVVMLRDVQDNKSDIPTTLTTANFIMHENQDIIAGYPYFIKPTKSTNSITANVSLSETTPSIVSVESTGNIVDGPQYGGIDCFQFTGNFESTEIPKGSYVMTNDGKLTRITNNVTAKPYRAFLKFTGTDYTPATSKVIKAANYDFLADEEGMEETSVEELLFQSGIFADKADVYNVNGQMIRANADNLQGLPKGIYIVNGKKFIVK